MTRVEHIGPHTLYRCDCIYCDAPIGHDEEAVPLGDEVCCRDCWEKRWSDMAQCAHEYEPDSDCIHGDRVCQKCGRLYPPELLPAAGDDGADVFVEDPSTGERTLIYSTPDPFAGRKH